ncbi:phage tail sheath C-terminal domain-containing protein [uncultured Aquimarina sp.]|uniref:phage tail sheath family protein n=1 Tax=uncultured Aquimarina sp. TaxID=575652 RepID=UPI002616208C|nr:phage tail sheath C-terminal domain-containing protein [uncultured Aquimarina sp.]
MATTYKTPGVYIEEIVKFPPSVAQVETAIPAFIGYTEKAMKKAEGDLDNIPTRITSLLEYETYFGNAKKETDITVSVIDEVISATPPTSANKSPFMMFYAMQIYFANGGGPCYIVSVGQYDANLSFPATLVEFSKLNIGLDLIRKEDEPTLLVFPDATSLLSDGDFYNLYKNALAQCKDLQDRFTIIDTYSDAEYNNDLNNDVNPDAAVRDGINSEKDYLKYGAVYYPFLETILDYSYDESQIDVTQSAAGPADVQQEVQDIADAIDTTEIDDHILDLDDLETQVNNAADDAASIALVPNIQAKINEIISYIQTLKSGLKNGLDIARADGSADTEANALDTWMTDELEQTVLDLNKTIDRLNSDDSKLTVQNEISTSTTNDPSLRRVLGVHNDDAAADSMKSKVDTLIASGELFTLIAALPSSGGGTTTVKLNTLEPTDNALYNRIKAEIGLLPIKLPPSSAMAGVYARVDSDRGVWKAPANVSVNYVTKPSVQVSHEDQFDLNVHTTGKSINAIRTFTGKGTLVWGARTLAGNDKEWRYVPVRRFFNMAEESIKKATEQFVFEPNDMNTWVRVKAMINNFLTLQWRAGALAGPTPDKAFYVNVGLGETMTANDILDGNMIIEIGMAVVRPAEFIILKFSHKMQEA